MTAMREMTLEEYLESKLPPFHLARRQLQELREERDALAANVEFCHKVLSMIENGPEYLVARQYRALRMARERKPETSLARLKAQWQAEALQKAMQEVEREPDTVKKGLIVAAMIRQLRRQAEGGEV